MARLGQFATSGSRWPSGWASTSKCLDVEWGEGVPVADYARILSADTAGAIKAVFVTHNETATGVTSDVAAVRGGAG